MHMYHGTVDAFVPSIRKEGLRPVAKNAWRVAWDGAELRDSEPVDSVYVTKSKRHAVEYAETRVRYYATQPGGTFSMFDAPHFFITKDQDAPVLQVKPVLIVIELDPHDTHLFEDFRDQGALTYTCPIPPSSIVEIVNLSVDLKEIIAPLYERSEDPYANLRTLITNY